MRKAISVTIGIATLCDGRKSVFCVADRMISTGSTQYQPDVRKIFHVTESIVLVIAGDIAIHSLAEQKLRAEISAKRETDWTVEACANRYAHYVKVAIRLSVEGGVLGPYGLDFEQFLVRQQTMSKNMCDLIFAKLEDAYLCTGAHAILAGIDKDHTGHVYAIDSYGVSCHDYTGYAVIGSGGEHAQSQLLFSSFSPNIDQNNGMILSYIAKKRSEVAAGVGEHTDMVMAVAYPKPVYFVLKDAVMDKLQKIYASYDKKIRASGKAAGAQCANFINAIESSGASNEPSGVDTP